MKVFSKDVGNETNESNDDNDDGWVEETIFHGEEFLLGFITYEKIEPDMDDIQSQIAVIMKRLNFVCYDRIENQQFNPEFARPHYHNDFEARWTVGGYGNFYIEANKGHVFKITVEENDFIIIPPEVHHWYEFPEELDNIHSVIRFFSTKEGRDTVYLDGGVKIEGDA